MQATTNGTLADVEVKFADKHACCVILASAGYPTSYKKGFEMTFTDEALAATFVAGAKKEGEKLLTWGGRVTGTTAIADSLSEAIKEAYRLSDGVKFEGAYRRSDIGQAPLSWEGLPVPYGELPLRTGNEAEADYAALCGFGGLCGAV